MEEKEVLMEEQLSMDIETKIVEVLEEPVSKSEKPLSPKQVKEQLSMDTLPHFKKSFIEIGKRQKTLKRIFYALFIVFMVGVLAFTVYKDFGSGKDLASFSEIFIVVGENVHFLICSLITLVVYVLLEVFKTSYMLFATTKKFRFKLAFESVMLGKYYDNVTPLASGGQPFQAYNMTKHGIDGGTATAVPIAALFLSQIAFFLVSIVAIIVDNNALLSAQPIAVGSTKIFFIIGLVCSMIFPVLVVLFCITPRFVTWVVTLILKLGHKLKVIKNPVLTKYKCIVAVKKYYKALKHMAKTKGCLTVGLIMSILTPIVSGTMTYFSLKTFGYDIAGLTGTYEWMQVVCYHMILSCAVSFIPTPGNAGASEFTFYQLFTANLLGGIGLTSMLFWRFLIYYFFVLYGIIYTVRNTIKAKKQAKISLK